MTFWALKVGDEEQTSEIPSFPDLSHFPQPLSLLSARQTLELILLLSQVNPHENKNLYENVPSGIITESSEVDSKNEIDNTDVDSVVEAMASKIPEVIINRTKSEEKLESAKQEEPKNTDIAKKYESKETLDEKNISKTNVSDICQGKLDELKVLLSNARKAVTNIVSSHDKLHSTQENETKVNEAKNREENVKPENFYENRSSTNSLEVWTTPDLSRSNSEGDCRAGRYHKKPAPKAPICKDEDEPKADEEASSSALKATLVIKTGRLKTFTNVSETKNVFVSHLPDSGRSRKKKSRRKEGFSKLLTIPKTFFNHTFHKDSSSAKDDEDDNSAVSDSSCGSRSRSVSVGSRGENPVDKIDLENALLKVALTPDENTETYIDLRSDGLDLCASSAEIMFPSKTNEQVAAEPEKTETKPPAKIIIRQMSHSPTRNSSRFARDDEH